MSRPVLVLVDIGAWLLIHVVVGYCAHRWPLASFLREKSVTRIRRFERDGGFWQRWVKVRSWKGRLPEAGDAFAGGVNKSRIGSRGTDALERYVAETRRAELAHWVVMAAAPFFALWNPWYASVVMLAYGVAVNAPCIISQRYNRARLLAVLNRRAAKAAAVEPEAPEASGE